MLYCSHSLLNILAVCDIFLKNMGYYAHMVAVSLVWNKIYNNVQANTSNPEIVISLLLSLGDV